MLSEVCSLTILFGYAPQTTLMFSLHVTALYYFNVLCSIVMLPVARFTFYAFLGFMFFFIVITGLLFPRIYSRLK